MSSNERLTENPAISATEAARRVCAERSFIGRTVNDIISDPATPKHIASLMADVVAAWKRFDADSEKLKKWALERRATEDSNK